MEVRVTQYEEITEQDWIRTIAYISAFISVIVVGAVFLIPINSIGIIFWLILVGEGLFLLVRWHAKTFAYRCPKCRHEFEISTFTDFISPHGISKSGGWKGWKYLKCPKCHERSRAIVIKKTKK